MCDGYTTKEFLPHTPFSREYFPLELAQERCDNVTHLTNTYERIQQRTRGASGGVWKQQ